MNVVRKKVGREAARLAGGETLSRYEAGSLVFARSELEIVRAALKVLKTARGAPSFIDCLVMAFADSYNTDLIFGFDETFSKNGYRLPSGRVGHQAA